MVLTQLTKSKNNSLFSILFPYHYGSHATHRLEVLLNMYGCFHTTMVLTQQCSLCSSRLLYIVSIPLWFSRNVRYSIFPVLIAVSIPLWFSRNSVRYQSWDSPLYVSIPLWFSRNGYLVDKIEYSDYVSIPLWFSRNIVLILGISIGVPCFHTTMVLTQRNDKYQFNNFNY